MPYSRDEIKEIWMRVIVRGRTKEETMRLVQGLAEKLASLDKTQVWVFGPDFTLVGKFHSRLFVRPVTSDILEKGGWLKFQSPTTAHLLYDDNYRIIVVTEETNLCRVETLVKAWIQVSRDEHYEVRIRNEQQSTCECLLER